MDFFKKFSTNIADYYYNNNRYYNDNKISIIWKSIGRQYYSNIISSKIIHIFIIYSISTKKSNRYENNTQQSHSKNLNSVTTKRN